MDYGLWDMSSLVGQEGLTSCLEPHDTTAHVPQQQTLQLRHGGI